MDLALVLKEKSGLMMLSKNEPAPINHYGIYYSVDEIKAI